MAHELTPPSLRPAPELAGHGVHGLGQALVRPEQQGERLLQDEGDLVADQRDRRIGGQPKRQGRSDVADVVAAAGYVGAARTVVEPRPQSNADARLAGEPLDRADDHRRPEEAAELLEAGREVGDPHRGAVAVAKRRHQDRGVLEVLLLAFTEPLEQDVEETAGLGIAVLVAVAGEEGMEDGVSVEVGQAGPADTAARIDQRSEPAVADHAAVERPYDPSHGPLSCPSFGAALPVTLGQLPITPPSSGRTIPVMDRSRARASERRSP